jgi:rod shape-determining protein MreC
MLISLQVPLGNEQSYFEKGFFSVFSPVQHGIFSFFGSIGKLWKNYFYFRNVQAQNQRMREDIFLLRQENNLLRNVLEKLRNEKEVEENISKIYQNILPAQVIGLDASNLYKSATINKGSLDGIKKNMVVLDKDGNLVGRIVGPVTLKEARIQLITDNESGVGVFSQINKVMGVLSGDANGLCSFNYVLVTEPGISDGEEVVTSGYDGIYPKGIKIGKIISMEDTTSLHKEIKVEPYFDFRYLDRLAVITTDLIDIF